MTRAIDKAFVAIAGLCLATGCGATRPAEAPAWQSRAVGGDCDLAAVVVLHESQRHALAEAAVSSARSLAPVHVPDGTRAEACVRLKPGSSDVDQWLVVVRGVGLDFTRALAVSNGAQRRRSGAFTVSNRGDGEVVLWPRTVAVASREAAGRLVDLSEDDVASPMSLPGGVFAAGIVRGEAAKRISHEAKGNRDDVVRAVSTGLVEAAAEVRFRDSRIEIASWARYEEAAQARDARAAVETAWRRLADPDDEWWRGSRLSAAKMATLRTISTLDVDLSGNVVTAVLSIGDLRSAPRRSTPSLLTRDTSAAPSDVSPARTPVAPPSSYDRSCPPGQRFDLDRNGCVSP